jgi:hypothetical protein
MYGTITPNIHFHLFYLCKYHYLKWVEILILIIEIYHIHFCICYQALICEPVDLAEPEAKPGFRKKGLGTKLT